MFRDYLIESGIKEEQIISIALDDDTCEQYRNPDELSKYIRSKIVNKEMYYILIDEVQYAITKQELENPEDIKLYNVLNGLMRLRNVDIYVTGSNSKLLSQDVMTAFRGRGDQVQVFPLSFKEYYDFVGGDKSETNEGKKTRKQCEIDFVVNMGSKRYYIQSALSVSDPDKMTTELRPLKNTKDFFKKIIISKTKAWTDEEGIVHIGLYDFLLNPNSLEL